MEKKRPLQAEQASLPGLDSALGPRAAIACLTLAHKNDGTDVLGLANGEEDMAEVDIAQTCNLPQVRVGLGAWYHLSVNVLDYFEDQSPPPHIPAHLDSSEAVG